MYKRHDATIQAAYHSTEKGDKLLKDVNNYYNWHLKYAPDQKDYWQSPAETIKRNSGDCEDFAIIKWQALLNSGIPENDMYFMIGFKEGGNVAHAILVVYLNGKPNYLDNESPIIWIKSIADNGSYMINRFGHKEVI